MTATKSLESLLERASGQPARMVRLARALLAKGLDEQARQLCNDAIEMSGDAAEVHSLASDVLSRGVPQWYFNMVNDRSRNEAYESAIIRRTRKDSSVLELGTGTGLFAMMAARSGAEKIVTCDLNKSVADLASQIVAKNDFAGQIRVVNKRVEELELGTDLELPADLVICDLLSNNMIGAGVLPAMEHTVRWLVRPGATVIPARGTIRIALAYDPRADARKMRTVEGLDLSPFNRLCAPSYQIEVGAKRLELRSDPVDLFEFDFESGGPYPQAQTQVKVHAFGGRVNGIVQWSYYQMDEEVHYEHRPAAGSTSAFDAIFYPLMRSVDIEPGASVDVGASHDRSTLNLWVKNR